MKSENLKEVLIAIGRMSEIFYRDTPMLLQTLDNLESVNRRFKNIGHNPERRNIKGTVKMKTVGEWLKSQGREYPKADANGSINGKQFEDARLPMVVACTGCTMTMVLTASRKCDDSGNVFCDNCAE